ncbi:MAG TPA: nitrilase-related carbon-nitrogen hydrolase [Beijerinckiaceae bacterium]|jgi:predicted amidohydrolase
MAPDRGSRRELRPADPMDRLTVAAAQIECRPGDVPANLALHLEAIREARARAVDLLVFPELSLTDYLPRPNLPRLARRPDAPEILALGEAAEGMLVSFGFIEDGGGRFHNAQALVSQGRVLHVHRKLNLPTYGRLTEGLHYTKGERIEPVAHGGWSLATLICAETWNPALPWLAALKGASLLLVPVASSLHVVEDLDNRSGWDVNLSHTALTYGLPLVMANHCGSRGGLEFWGGSRILDAFGRKLAQAGEAPELVVATLALDDGRRARERLPTVRDADPKAVAAELERFLAERERTA